MNLDNLNKWLTLAANIGVIAGIFFLGVEVSQQNDAINQSNSIANAQFLAEDLASRTSAYDVRIGESLPETWSRAVTNSPDFSDKDLIVLDAFLSREWMRAVQSRNVLESGFEQSDLEVRAVEWVYQYLGNKYALMWWEDNHLGLINLHPELRDLIDSYLEEIGDSHSQGQQMRYKRMRDRL